MCGKNGIWKVKPKACANSGCEQTFNPRNSTDKYCSSKCFWANQKPSKPRQPIKSVSPRRQRENKEYTKKRRAFLAKPQNRICFIEGCKKKSTTIEHRAGRIGSNYLNEEFWAGCCLFHNLELERNPELSKKYQLSKIHGGKKG